MAGGSQVNEAASEILAGSLTSLAIRQPATALLRMLSTWCCGPDPKKTTRRYATVSKKARALLSAMRLNEALLLIHGAQR